MLRMVLGRQNIHYSQYDMGSMFGGKIQRYSAYRIDIEGGIQYKKLEYFLC